MPTQPDIRRYQSALTDLADLASRDLRDFLRSLATDDPKRIARAVREFMPELVNAYSLMASTAAADWYDDLRTEALVAAGLFTAQPLEAPEADAVQDALTFALAPLFTPTDTDALGRLVNLTDEVISSSGRQTVEHSAAADRARPRYARHASANACAFCRMLATRGAEYRSEESATRVVLASRRNKQDEGETYHDNCHCVAVPVWDSVTYDEAPYVADWREDYYAAVEQVGNASDTKAILAAMRANSGAR